MTLEDLANHIAASDAFQATYPSYLTNQEFAEAFLGNVLGGENVAAALMSAAVDIVVGLLNDGMTRGALGLAVVHALLEINAQGAEHPAHGDLGGVAAQLANQVAVAEHYTINARMADPSSDVLDGVTSDAATAGRAIHDIDSPPANAVFDEVGELSIMENTASGSVGSVTASDPNSTAMYPEPVSYSLKDAPDGFSIDAASGEISYMGDGLDYETTPSVDLTVVATSTGADGTATGVEKMVTVMVGDVSELGPVFSDEIGEFALYEHADGSEEPIGVGTITASDGDGDTVSYSIKGDPEDWAILQDGKLCYIGSGIDYEDMSSVDLTIVATSMGANGEDESVEQGITVMVHNRSDAVFGDPDLTFLNERASGADEAITLGSVAATDADGDEVSYRLAGPAVDSDNDAILHTGFAIDSNGVITYSGPGIHHSTTQSVDLTVVATSIGDNGQETDVETMVSVEIRARADAMFEEVGDLVLTENADGSGDGNAISVGYVRASDANGDTIAYSIKGSPDDWAILADGKLCYIGSGIDYEEMSSVDLTIVASSIGANGLPTELEQAVTVDITNLNDNAPTGVSDLTGTGTIHAMMLDADTPTGYTFSVMDADGSAGMYTATVYEGEGDEMAVSTRFAAVQDADDPLSFSLVAAAGTDLQAGDVSLTIKVSDGGMDDEGEPTSAMNMVSFTVPDAPPPPPPEPKEGETFVLTLGIDRFTGTADNDTFVADINAATGSLFALGSLDRIDGGDGDDSLQVFRLGNFVFPTTATLRNVEALEVSATGSVKATLSPFAGLETIELAVVGNESVDPLGNTAADGSSGTADDFNLALDLNAGGAAVTAGVIDGVICIQDASTVEILEASASSVVKIGSGGNTTSVSVTGGASVDIGKMFAAQAGTFPGVTGASETVTSVMIDKVASAASIDFDADNTDDGSIRIVSKAIESVSLANTYGNARITNGSSDAEDLALTVNKYGGQMIDTDNDGTPDAPAVAEISLDGDGAAENVSIAVDGASNLKLRNDATKTVSISGSEALVLQVNKADDSVSDTLESISVSGDAGLTFVANVHSSLESIDASGSMGKNSLTITDAADLETISTGGGNDSVTVTAAAKLESINTGGGNDKVTVNANHRSDGLAVDLGAGDDTYTVGAGTPSNKSTVQGGAGTDVLAMTVGANSTAHVNAAGASIYSGFEVLAVGGGSGDYDLDKLGISNVVAAGVDTAGAVNLKNAAAGTTVTVDGTDAGASPGRSATIVYELKDASGTADSMTVNLMAKGGKDDAPAGPGGSPAAVTTGETTLALTADGVETVVINSSVTAGGKQMASAYTNTVTLATGGTSTIKTLDINGAGKANVNADAITTLTMVDATGNSAGVVVSATGAAAAVTFNGGSGGDTFTGGGQRDILNGGGGKDTLNGGAGADILTGGAGGDTLNGGAGGDSYRFTSASDSRVSFGDGGAASGFDMIVGFATADGDLIALSRSLGVTDADLSGGSAVLSKANITDTDTPANATDDLMDYIGDGADFFSDGVDDKAIAFATDGVNGYVFIDVNGNGNFDVATDMVIRLDGITTAVDGTAFDIV